MNQLATVCLVVLLLSPLAAWAAPERPNVLVICTDQQHAGMLRCAGVGCSDANLEIRWFMNRQFRLALLHDWEKSSPETVIDFTRYDLPAREPQDLSRNWSLLGRINQKQTRPQDQPCPLAALPEDDRALIRSVLPELGA